MSWEVLVAIVVALLVFGFVAVLLLVRDPISRRIRIGVFVERNGEQRPNEEPPGS